MKAIFFGSPDFACPSLEALSEIAEICAVVTQPDRPAGRGLALHAPAVKELALQRGYKVLQPTRLRDGELARTIVEQKVDVAVVVAYGRILPKEILNAPRCGCINVHASLLPRWRGAAPIQRAIAAGDKNTGVCLMQLDEGMDTGPIFAQSETEIRQGESAGELSARLALLGAQLLKRELPRILEKEIVAQAQDESDATLAPKLSSKEGAIDWSKSAEQIARLVCAMNPWPSAHCGIKGQVLKVFKASLEAERATTQAPGAIEGIESRGIMVATGQGTLLLQEVQQSGRKKMSAQEFAAGARLDVGISFDAGEKIMKIYTKTGDEGETGLFGGARVSKSDVRVISYGEIDELNSAIGWVRVDLSHKVLSQQLEQIQNELFDLGAELACVPEKLEKLPGKRVNEHDTQQLELAIDAMENDLNPLQSFVLPGGAEHAARLHLARCICRRAERAMLIANKERALRGETLRYINRLSDYLFVAARWVNHRQGVADVLWQPRKG